MTREFVAWAILYALGKVRESQKLLLVVNLVHSTFILKCST